MNNLQQKYVKETIPHMRKIFGYENDLSVPKIEKIVLNIGVGRLSQQPNFKEKILPEIMGNFALITGQKPKANAAKKSIAGFKIRAGQTVGLQVTLRRSRMYDFLEKLVKIVMPRVRDFRGIDVKNIDEHGNLSIGLKDQLVFPEVNPETSKIDFGLQITVVASAKNRQEAVELYRLLGIPLKKT